MAGEIKSAAEATKIASTFLKQYYGFLRPISAKRYEGIWKVRIDVGVVDETIAEVEVDASTSEVIEYSMP